MPTTVTATVQLFTLPELDDRAREKAIEAYQDCNVDYQDWHDATLEMCEEELTAVGIQSPEIRYSGFYHQGSYALFIGDVDLAEWMRSQKIAGKYRTLYNAATAGEIRARIIPAYRDSAQTDIELYGSPATPEAEQRLYAQANAVEELLEEWRSDKSHEIYKALRDEYEYLTSEEAIAETIEANEWRFTQDGYPEHQLHLSDYYQ